jgi:hypothetical protein
LLYNPAAAKIGRPLPHIGLRFFAQKPRQIWNVIGRLSRLGTYKLLRKLVD